MSYVALQMQPSHRDALLRLWRENLTDLAGGSDLAARAAWAHRDKPDGLARTIVVVDQATGELVGCGSAYPRAVTLDGVKLLAGVLADFAVSRSHRSGGAALLIQRALATGKDEPPFSFLYGLPNHAARPIFKRIGYREIGETETWVKPLRSAYKLREYLHRGSFARFAALPVDSYLAAADARRTRRFPPADTLVADRADRRFDDLWIRARRMHALTGERTCAYLNWRYSAHTTSRHEFYCVREPARDELLGYVVFSRRNNRIDITDLFAADVDETAERLLLRFTCDMRRHGCDSVSIGYFGNARLARCFERAGFVRRAEAPRHVMLMTRAVTQEQAKAIANVNNWRLFSGEMDV